VHTFEQIVFQKSPANSIKRFYQSIAGVSGIDNYQIKEEDYENNRKRILALAFALLCFCVSSLRKCRSREDTADGNKEHPSKIILTLLI
jgi:hypothetical protein